MNKFKLNPTELALINIRPDILSSFIDSGDATHESLTDTSRICVPLWYIVKCWEILFNSFSELLKSEYNHVMYCQEPADRDLVQAFQDHKKVVEILQTRLGIDIHALNMDISGFNEFTDETVDEVMDTICSTIEYSDTLQNAFYYFEALDSTDISDLLRITSGLYYARK